ncbi:MAG: DUF3592 domain-containing protein [Lentisphaerae bacterium]|nr:DUF3592 domain-containing protein [Lentisphaerota bacterium]
MKLHPAEKTTGSRLLPVFGIIFILAGCFFIHILAGQPLGNVLQSRSWVKVPAVVESSELKRRLTHQDNLLALSVVYNYQYMNKVYRSSRYDFFRTPELYTNIGVEDMSLIVQQYPAGSEIAVYVDPAQPEQAVISRDIVWTRLLWCLLPLLFVGVGSGVLIGWWRKKI